MLRMESSTVSLIFEMLIGEGGDFTGKAGLADVWAADFITRAFLEQLLQFLFICWVYQPGWSRDPRPFENGELCFEQLA